MWPHRLDLKKRNWVDYQYPLDGQGQQSLTKRIELSLLSAEIAAFNREPVKSASRKP
jgi:hypothetical protein